jgi:hypothetical protein
MPFGQFVPMEIKQMSMPGLIARPLLPDEFSLFFESRDPIPLGRMATFLRKVETEVSSIVESEGLFLELSEYSSGSGEPRFRIVCAGRIALKEASDLHNREVEAVERQADVAEKWGRRNFIGAMLVNPVAAAIAASMVSGALNPSAKTIVYEGDVTQVFVTTPDNMTVLPAKEIETGRNRKKSGDLRLGVESAEIARLTHSLRNGSIVRLAGRVQTDRDGPTFQTLAGNKLGLVGGLLTDNLLSGRGPVVIEAVVASSGSSWAIKPVNIIMGLDDL